jgi:chromosome segregation ATPase
MDQRQLEKERIRLTRDIAMLESQLQSAQRGKEEKLEENKTIREEIAKLEEENVGLEKETQRLDGEIGKLDEEFKQAQLDAGRLRREIKISQEHADNENKLAADLRADIAKLENQLGDFQRQVKREIDDRRGLEAKLRKTNAVIDSMKDHPLAKQFVTKRLEKLDWYQRQEEPLPGYDGESGDYEPASDETIEEVASEAEVQVEVPKEPKKSGDEGGIDFSVD